MTPGVKKEIYRLTPDERELVDEFEKEFNRVVGFVCRLHKLVGNVHYSNGAIFAMEENTNGTGGVPSSNP